MDILKILNNKKHSLNRLRDIRRNTLPEKEMECPECKGTFLKSTIKSRGKVCPDCGYYFPLKPRERIRLLADEGSFHWKEVNLRSKDPLHFPGYEEKLEKLREKTGQMDGAVCGTMRIDGIKVAVGVLDAGFFMGSMGTVVGEQVTRITEYAERKGYPLILFCLSGGARMQEGIFSLMQMAKTSAAIEKFKENGGLYISVLCHPTTGGVSASFAFLGDIILAEPGALIGFAGPRVIAQTIGQELPEGFQRAESQMQNGMIDGIVTRSEMKETLAKILRLHNYGK